MNEKSDQIMEGENACKIEQEDNRSDVPPDLLKPYFFGCGPVHPKWLQLFANKKFFTFLSCCFTSLYSSVVSGLISVVLSTIQTRYHFSSFAAGFIVIAHDVSVALSITLVTYFASYFHKPRVLGIGCLLLGLTGFLFASPQFLFGKYESGSGSILHEHCFDNRTVSIDCASSANTAAYTIFVLSSILLSLPSSVLHTLTTSYIDEIVRPRFVSLHIGTFNIFLVLGPAMGYLVGSVCLSVYVDPWIETSLTESDPAWVGAWWIPFIVVGVLSTVLSIPYLLFPKWLSDSYLVREERRKEMARVYPDKILDEHKFVAAVKLFPIQIKRLMLNPSFMLASFGLASIYIFTQGVISFAPKYLESQFYLSPSIAGLVTGVAAIPASVFGVLIGSVLLYIFKWNAKQNIIAVSVVTLTSLPFLLTYIIHCPEIALAGITTEYGDGSMTGIDGSVCASSCNCTSSLFEPVCGRDGITYFSACRAGCSEIIDEGFQNCTCVAESNDRLYVTNAATDGTCESTCLLIVPAIFLFVISIIFAFITSIPYQYFILRIVSDEQRALALGFQSAIWRVFGAVPGPLLFGALFDLSCAMWQMDDCGNRGHCWIYHNTKLSVYVTSVAFPCVSVGGLLFVLAVIVFPKTRSSIDTNDDELNDSYDDELNSDELNDDELDDDELNNDELKTSKDTSF